ncbi:hypothetical protein YK48G_07870 [Lentilactobacillus fungorum]|uniref:Uncharacterized protein n=1 Tax=Lentilactobacillus fungorum TaxID=2201250 RepID=A0ABQ3VYJ5_9LACO|nr:hypothetical protein [Lentilactobacillus fungorum]GHP13362.1 hypothetical protein YK48G_07870 [Lentilactobacillus fungorum]
MKKADEGSQIHRLTMTAGLFYVQTAMLIGIVIYDFFKHGTSYVASHPIILVLFVTLFLSGIWEMWLSNDLSKSHGLLQAGIGILLFDLVAAIFLLLNLGKPGVIIYVSCIVLGSLIVFIAAALIIRAKKS